LHPDVPAADFASNPGESNTVQRRNSGESHYRLAGQDSRVERVAELGAQEVFLPKLLSELQN